MKSTIEILSQVYKEKLTQNQFNKISAFINNETGIRLPEEKKTMLQSRLYKRLKSLNLPTFKDYFDYTFSKEGYNSEINNMIDVVCTNKTSFFREAHHFDFIVSNILPEFINSVNGNRNVNIWSAGCSSGEEVYTIAMVLDNFITNHKILNYSILGTDISTQIIQIAINAIYPEEKAIEIPNEYKKEYLLKSKNRIHPTIRIIPELRQKVSFKKLNLIQKSYNLNQNFDIVFCRNVTIYFEREIQEKVINKICNYLKTGGYLFIGHSESVFNMDVPLKQIKPTIFQRI